MQCRFCKENLVHEFIDLFNSPASNSFLSQENLNEPESFFPLKVFVCHRCFLVQVDEYKKSGDIFNSDYVYFSSFSTSWLEHARKYAEMMISRFGYNNKSLVVEIASNDGYLLQYFKNAGIPVLGIEPTSNTAAVAESKGIKSVVDFFGLRLANQLVAEKNTADLILGNNVLAHVPDIIDFVGGMKLILHPGGVITMEFPHLLRLVDQNQFDTIYHEHFSYLSLYSVKQIFESQGLELFDVEEITTHGGSLRIFAKHSGDSTHLNSGRVSDLLNKEISRGINNLNYYHNFQDRALQVKLSFLNFLIEQKKAGKKVVGYGAAAKGNTLLNYCGVKNDLISFVVDANPFKQGKYLPGSHIPVVSEAHLQKERPDFIVIFPWNLKDEIVTQLNYISAWGGKFVIPIPYLEIM